MVTPHSKVCPLCPKTEVHHDILTEVYAIASLGLHSSVVCQAVPLHLVAWPLHCSAPVLAVLKPPPSVRRDRLGSRQEFIIRRTSQHATAGAAVGISFDLFRVSIVGLDERTRMNEPSVADEGSRTKKISHRQLGPSWVTHPLLAL